MHRLQPRPDIAVNGEFVFSPRNTNIRKPGSLCNSCDEALRDMHNNNYSPNYLNSGYFESKHIRRASCDTPSMDSGHSSFQFSCEASRNSFLHQDGSAPVVYAGRECRRTSFPLGSRARREYRCCCDKAGIKFEDSRSYGSHIGFARCCLQRSGRESGAADECRCKGCNGQNFLNRHFRGCLLAVLGIGVLIVVLVQIYIV